MKTTLTVYKPEYTDLFFKQLMMEDAETMSYNHAWGGTIAFPEEKWSSWYDKWIINTEGKRYYRYLRNNEDQFVGEIAFYFDEEINGYMADVVIHAKYRRRGYGTEALRILCDTAHAQGIQVLYDNIAIDNPSIHLFLKHGFHEVSRTNEAVLLKKEL